MNINPAYALIKQLISEIEITESNFSIIIKAHSDEANHFYSEWKRLEIVVKNLQEENDELRMKLAASKAENKKGFNQIKSKKGKWNNGKNRINNHKDDLSAAMKEQISHQVAKEILKHKDNIENSLKTLFGQSTFGQLQNYQFQKALDWALEDSFRTGLNSALEELKFSELIAEKAKILLQNDKLIEELALAKVRASLGLDKESN